MCAPPFPLAGHSLPAGSREAHRPPVGIAATAAVQAVEPGRRGYARLSGRWLPAGRFSLGRLALPVNIAAVTWLTFEAINIAWPRTVLAPPGAKFYQVCAIVLIFGVLTVVGLAYVLLRRPQDRVATSAAMGDLTEAAEMAAR
jgi:hypothetical protein